MTGAGPGHLRADDPGDLVGCADLADPTRLLVLRRLGLAGDSDARMEDLSAWVREAVGVPVALVSLVQPDAQVFPGMAGLPEPWASKRSTPLSHSFCRHVVESARPLVVSDAREHPLVRDNLAVPDLGVVAYAGMPLTDDDGNVLGSLCAIDTEPRTWTDAELETLRRIADACATDLRLRLARYDSDLEGVRRDELEAAQRRSLDRSETLLRTSQTFTDTLTVSDVHARICDLVSTELRPTVVGTVIVDERRRLRRLDDLGDPALSESFSLEDLTPAAEAIREARIVHHPDRASFDAAYPESTRAVLHRLGGHTCVAVPLPGGVAPIGAIVLAWDRPHAIEPDDLLTLASVAGFAAQAFGRAGVLHHRTSVAHELQHAMLTRLPAVEGLLMAARYEPADAREYVGGDWYDAAPVADPAHAGEPVLAVSVGDIIGHTLDAATVMSQVRSMLRQSAWDHPDGPPSATLRAFEAANFGLGLDAAGTAVVAHLRRITDGRWSMTWTNAGHPPPVLLHPDGTAELLTDHDVLFGFRVFGDTPRTDHRRTIEPGSTLFLYTDGLVERRGSDIDAGTDALIALLRRLRERPVREIADTAVETLATDAADDVVTFAIHFPEV